MRLKCLQGVSKVQGWVWPDDSILTEYEKHSPSQCALKYILNYLCAPLTKFPPYTGAVVLGFLEPKNKLFIDGEVRMLLGMVVCWLPAAPQPGGGHLHFNESCFVSFSY